MSAYRRTRVPDQNTFVQNSNIISWKLNIIFEIAESSLVNEGYHLKSVSTLIILFFSFSQTVKIQMTKRRLLHV